MIRNYFTNKNKSLQRNKLCYLVVSYWASGFFGVQIVVSDVCPKFIQTLGTFNKS